MDGDYELIPVANSKVSSVFLANQKTYGKQFMFDDNEETCWSSEQGNKPIHIQVLFKKKYNIKYIEILGQGGYCPKDVEVYSSEENSFIEKDKDSFVKKITIEPLDTNNAQKFELNIENATTIKLTSLNSYDPFGRIVIYKLSFYGKESEEV